MPQFTEGIVGDSTQVAKWNFTGKTDKSEWKCQVNILLEETNFTCFLIIFYPALTGYSRIFFPDFDFLMDTDWLKVCQTVFANL